MQDRYVGDIGDFGKYGLLRAIRGAKDLGVAWYLHPDAGPTGDGRHTLYLQHPDEWRHLDTELFDTLQALMTTGRRSVAAIEESGILGNSVFVAERLDVAGARAGHRERWRQEWFNRTMRKLVCCDLVFADPDNGLVPNDGFRARRQVNAKDSDGNYLATCQAPETVKNGLRPGAVDNFISITVLSGYRSPKRWR